MIEKAPVAAKGVLGSIESNAQILARSDFSANHRQ